jgi:hypothetical protein
MVAQPADTPVTETLATPVDEAAFIAGTVATAVFELVNRTIGVRPLSSELTVATPGAVDPAVTA